MISGQISLARAIATYIYIYIIYITGNCDLTSLLVSFYILDQFLGSCSLITGLSVENKNTRQGDKDENWGSGKSKNFHRISGYDPFFTGNGVPIPSQEMGPRKSTHGA